MLFYTLFVAFPLNIQKDVKDANDKISEQPVTQYNKNEIVLFYIKSE